MALKIGKGTRYQKATLYSDKSTGLVFIKTGGKAYLFGSIGGLAPFKVKKVRPLKIRKGL